jgi:hypothetical protein
MPELLSRNKRPLQVGDIVKIDLVVAQTFPAVEAVEVVREGVVVGQVAGPPPRVNTVRFGAMAKDCKSPIPTPGP